VRMGEKYTATKLQMTSELLLRMKTGRAPTLNGAFLFQVVLLSAWVKMLCSDRASYIR